jgi:hypothetical protein
MAVAVVVAGLSAGAVAIAIDENGAGEPRGPAGEPPAYGASIHKEPAEPGGAVGPVETDEQKSPPSDSPKGKREPGSTKTQWVTDLDESATADPPDQPSRAKTATPGEKQSKDATLDPSLAEILQIRRELGPSPFHGTIFEGADSTPAAAGGEARESGDLPGQETEDEFAEALRATAATAEVQPRIAYPGPPYSRWRDESAGDARLAGDLRQGARGLDLKAADFEDLELYVEADQLRQLARRLRTTARRLRQGAPPAVTP